MALDIKKELRFFGIFIALGAVLNSITLVFSLPIWVFAAGWVGFIGYSKFANGLPDFKGKTLVLILIHLLIGVFTTINLVFLCWFFPQWLVCQRNISILFIISCVPLGISFSLWSVVNVESKVLGLIEFIQSNRSRK